MQSFSHLCLLLQEIEGDCDNAVEDANMGISSEKSQVRAGLSLTNNQSLDLCTDGWPTTPYIEHVCVAAIGKMMYGFVTAA